MLNFEFLNELRKSERLFMKNDVLVFNEVNSMISVRLATSSYWFQKEKVCKFLSYEFSRTFQEHFRNNLLMIWLDSGQAYQFLFALLILFKK